MYFGWVLVFSCCFVFVNCSDNYRPQYHALPPSNWINDPNGPIYYMGQYHLFFQYNPYEAVWGNITWGHMRKLTHSKINHTLIIIKK